MMDFVLVRGVAIVVGAILGIIWLYVAARVITKAIMRSIYEQTGE